MRLALLEVLRNTLLERGPLAFHNEDVWERVCAVNTWGSNAIEGNDLGRAEVETLVLQDISIGGHPVWKVLETVQHAKAFMGLLDRLADPIGASTALELHDQVLRGVVQGAGRWREVDIHIKGSMFVPPSAGDVAHEMEAWEAGYADGVDREEEVFDLASNMHQTFEAIHPFNRGNGRVGRLLLNLHFLKHDWPPVNLGLPVRMRYFQVLETGHDGDLTPMREFLMEEMGSSLMFMLDLVGTAEDRLKPLEELEARGSGFLAYTEHMAEEGSMPALRIGNAWHSSRRALSLFNEDGGEE
jgi:fido (protein-threonine AMPylation protein)